MSNITVEPDAVLTQLTEPIEHVEQQHVEQQDNVNLLKLPEALLDNPNIVDCVSEAAPQLDVCLHDTDNCNQPTRKRVQTPQMG